MIRLPVLLLVSAFLGAAQSEPAELSYKVDAEWPAFPAGMNFGPAASVDTDRNGNTYVFRRVEPPVLVFDKNGDFSRAFGAGLFANPHGIRIDPAGNVWGVDDGSHVAIKMNSRGRVLMGPRPAGFRRQGPRPLRRAHRYRLRARRGAVCCGRQ